MEYNQTKINDVVIIELKGKINAGNSEMLKSIIKDLVDKNEKNIVFNFAEVDFIDSSGLGSLVGCLRTVKRNGGDIKIGGLVEKVRVVFELIRLNHLFDIHDNAEKAAQSYRN